MFKNLMGMPGRLVKQKERFARLLSEFSLTDITELARAMKDREDFRAALRAFWEDVAKEEGGKVSLMSAGLIAGGALGSIGIAVAGTAFGAPLALILGLTGLAVGAEMDTSKKLEIDLSHELLKELQRDAKTEGVSPEQFAAILIARHYGG